MDWSARRLRFRPLLGTLCAVLVIIRHLKHHLLGYFVLHIIGKTARFVGAFAPVLRVIDEGGRHKVSPMHRRRSLVLRLHAFTPLIKLTTTRHRKFVDGNRRLAHSVSVPTRRIGKRRAGTCTSLALAL
jgi:hypothetical protein